MYSNLFETMFFLLKIGQKKSTPKGAFKQMFLCFYKVFFTSTSSKASTMSPSFMSLKLSIFKPHS